MGRAICLADVYLAAAARYGADEIGWGIASLLPVLHRTVRPRKSRVWWYFRRAAPGALSAMCSRCSLREF